MSTIIAQLQTEPWLALPVLKNVIIDYGERPKHHGHCTQNAYGYAEPAEEAARKNSLCSALANLLITFEELDEDISGILSDVCCLYDVIIDGECKS